MQTRYSSFIKSISAAGRKGRIYFLGGMADHEVTKLRLAGFSSANTVRVLKRYAEQAEALDSLDEESGLL